MRKRSSGPIRKQRSQKKRGAACDALRLCPYPLGCSFIKRPYNRLATSAACRMCVSDYLVTACALLLSRWVQPVASLLIFVLVPVKALIIPSLFDALIPQREAVVLVQHRIVSPSEEEGRRFVPPRKELSAWAPTSPDSAPLPLLCAMAAVKESGQPTLFGVAQPPRRRHCNTTQGRSTITLNITATQ